MTVKHYDKHVNEVGDGEFVTYSDYQKLVAENAALKLAISNEVGLTAMMPSPETPATDAAIAEIKAQGVDEFKDWNDTHIEIGDEYADILREVSKACSIFAANLRAGRKG